MKPGDIIFWSLSEHFKGHFYIALESVSGNFKYFSSYEGKLFVDSFPLSQLKYLSEGFWEFK